MSDPAGTVPPVRSTTFGGPAELGGQALVALVVVAVVGALTESGWPGFVLGALLALVLWVMAFFAAYGRSPRPAPVVPLRTYAACAALGLLIGYVMFLAGDGPTWWVPGFIVAGSLAMAGPLAARAG